MKKILFLLAIAAAVTTGSCNKINVTGDDKLPEGYVPVSSLTLDAPKTTINVNEEIQLTATVLPEDATYPEVTWSSSEEGIASVSASGLVKGLVAGQSTITASADGREQSVLISVVKPVPSGAVDLGLSVYWRGRNLGASKNTDAGDYYAWGENNTRSSSNPYTRDNYLNWESGTGYKNTVIDNNKLYDPCAKLYPQGTWRMPTAAEVEELIQKCNIFERISGSTTYYRVLSKSDNNKYIDIPKCGISNSESTYYWTSTFGSTKPAAMLLTKIGSAPVITLSSYDGWCGLPIRPVCDK